MTYTFSASDLEQMNRSLSDFLVVLASVDNGKLKTSDSCLGRYQVNLLGIDLDH